MLLLSLIGCWLGFLLKRRGRRFPVRRGDLNWCWGNNWLAIVTEADAKDKAQGSADETVVLVGISCGATANRRTHHNGLLDDNRLLNHYGRRSKRHTVIGVRIVAAITPYVITVTWIVTIGVAVRV